MVRGILKLFVTNVHNNKTMYHTQILITFLQGQDHNWRSKKHVLLQGIFCVQSITSSQIKGFLNYFTQTFTIVSQCVMRKKQSPTSNVKVTVGGQKLTKSVIGFILFPVHNFLIHQGIWKILGINVDNNMLCATLGSLSRRSMPHLDDKLQCWYIFLVVWDNWCQHY
jgi:hypothetical protein